MISFMRISAIILRHLRVLSRDLHKASQAFYWPLLDIVIWGFTSRWIAQEWGSDGINTVLLIMAPLALWQIVFRTNYDVAGGILEELWAHNMVNLFTTPLRLSEWMVATVALAGFMASVVFVVCTVAIYAFFGVSLLSLGIPLFLSMISLFLAGLAIGFFTTGILVVYGMHIQSIVFMSVWLFAPFSAVYYSLSALPPVLQNIAWCFPMAPVMEAMRMYVITGAFQYSMYAWGTFLSVLYCMLGVFFFMKMFKKSTQYGLARLVE